jgi:hypothetical protein
MKKVFVVILALVSLGFVGLAIYYWKTPADMLPHFMPGYEKGVTAAHTKHGIAALVLAVAVGIAAWFKSGSKSNAPESTPKE